MPLASKRPAEDSPGGRPRKRKGVQPNEFDHHGHFYLRALSLTDHPFNVACEGVQIDARSSLAGVVLDAEEQRKLSIAREMHRRLPGLQRLLEAAVESDGSDLKNACDRITEAGRSARSTDTNAVKKHIASWGNEPAYAHLWPADPKYPRLDPNGNTARGFKHYFTGALSSPPDLDYEKHKVELAGGVRVFGNITIGKTTWASCLWEEGKYNPEKIIDGLLKGSWVLRAYKLIWHGPQVAISTEIASKKGGNAHIHNFKRATLASIVYAAVQVQYALSDAKNWGTVTNDMAPLALYDSLMCTFIDPLLAKHVKSLEDWYTAQVFPNSSAATTDPPADSMQARLKAQVAADAAAALAVAATAAAAPAAATNTAATQSTGPVPNQAEPALPVSQANGVSAPACGEQTGGSKDTVHVVPRPSGQGQS